MLAAYQVPTWPLVGGIDYELDVLLSLDGFVFQFAAVYRVEIAPQRFETTRRQPRRIKYNRLPM